MLYRTYRPQKFSELVGLDPVKNTLQSQVKDGKTAHAYLFAGPRGTGKTTTARILAKAINCEHSKAGEPDGVCRVCKQIEDGRYLDLIEIDAASNRGIEDIRSLREKIRLAPSVGRYKVYIIDEAHMLTADASNALLKTLEEPPAHAIFILATTEPHRLLETIRSRCQRFTFERAPVALIVEKLKEIVKREKAKISDENLEQIAKAAGGGFRDAETLLEQVLIGGAKIEDLVGFSKLADLGGFFDNLIAGQVAPALVFVNDLSSQGIAMDDLGEKILEYLRDLLLIKVGVGDELVEVPAEQYKVMSRQAQEISEEKLEEMINKFTQAYDYLSQAVIPSLPLEVAVVEVASNENKVSDASKDSNGGKKESEIQETNQPINQFPPKTDQPRAEISKPDDQWSALMMAVKPLNHSVEAFLRSATGELRGKNLTISAFYPFHKERLDDPRNRKILETAVQEVYGKGIKIKVELKEMEKKR
ncbi:MAG TPA: DNA polymerase III subunit gamma/tau [Patescibacteria group bacterium]|nr:DNA polymerase III subunit gamma/tau [Patescibacteria group bacterium]